MRLAFFLIGCAFLASCDDARTYETNYDFENRYWLVQEKPSFTFEISSSQEPVSIYCNIRNSVDYPYSRIFVRYAMKDSAGVELKSDLVSTYLFDQKTGKPLGSSGIGDIYDHRIALFENFQFTKPGAYTIQVEQFMRTDTLQGILATGIRVEKVNKKN